jgi:hypothetical protein
MFLHNEPLGRGVHIHKRLQRTFGDSGRAWSGKNSGERRVSPAQRHQNRCVVKARVRRRVPEATQVLGGV